MNREELERDHDAIVAQIQQMQGALQYVMQKLAALDKLKEDTHAGEPDEGPKSPSEVEEAG